MISPRGQRRHNQNFGGIISIRDTYVSHLDERGNITSTAAAQYVVRRLHYLKSSQFEAIVEANQPSLHILFWKMVFLIPDLHLPPSNNAFT